MKMPAFRCSVAAEERADGMLGTAPPQARVLLVHQPGAWGPRGLVESRCDPAVARRIDAASASAGMRLQAIRRPGKHEPGKPEGGYEAGIADTLAATPAITWWRFDDFAELAGELEAGGPTRAPIAIDPAPLYLVCAHGRHDACCALRGRPIARELHDARPGRVWETTHLGGDRFAANVLVLPTGELYGRVTEADANDLAARHDAGELLPDRLRGRIGLAPFAQAALAGAHRQLGISRRDALSVHSIERSGDHERVVTLATPRGSIAVTVVADLRPPAQLTCNGRSPVPSREYRITHIGSPQPALASP